MFNDRDHTLNPSSKILKKCLLFFLEITKQCIDKKKDSFFFIFKILNSKIQKCKFNFSLEM